MSFTTIKNYFISFCFIMSLLSANEVFAAEPINTLEKSGLFSYKPSGVAIRGADTVAYFTEGKPMQGLDDFTTEWNGATWKFASQKHLDLFVTNPEKYAPQYGGYCAYGVAKDNLVKIEPENWAIVDGKLYLNFNDGLQKKWEGDIKGYVSEANKKYQSLLLK